MRDEEWGALWPAHGIGPGQGLGVQGSHRTNVVVGGTAVVVALLVKEGVSEIIQR